jgi:hypothetical protein
MLESSKHLEFMSLRWKEPYYDKFQYHRLQEGYFSVQGRFYANSNSEKSDPLFPSRRPNKMFRRSSVNNIRLNDVAIPSRRPSMSRRFEQFKVASVQRSWQHVRLDAHQGSTSNRISFTDTYIGRQLHPFG